MLKKQAICSVAYLKRGKDRYNMIEGKGGAMDIKLHYQEKGSGYPLILLHGNGEDGSRFRHQIEYFSKEYRVIAIVPVARENLHVGRRPLRLNSSLRICSIS